LLGMGVISSPTSPAEFAAFVRSEGQKLNNIIKTSGVKPE